LTRFLRDQPPTVRSRFSPSVGAPRTPTSAAPRWPRPTASRGAVALSRNPWPRRTRSRSTTNGAMPRRRPRSLRPLTELGPGHACGHRRLRLRHRHLHLLLVMYAYMHSPAAGRILICTACARSLGAVRATHPTTLLTQPCATRLRSAVSAVRLGVRFPRRFPQPNASSRLPPPPRPRLFAARWCVFVIATFPTHQQDPRFTHVSCCSDRRAESHSLCPARVDQEP
jgi:hypothetical protein